MTKETNQPTEHTFEYKNPNPTPIPAPVFQEYETYPEKSLEIVNRLKAINPRFYISGPISGYPDLNAPAFERAEELLKGLGIVPINPLKVVDLSMFKTPMSPEDEWAYCMKADLKEMYGCGAVVLLDNWKKSPGASWEYLNAKTLKIPALNLSTLGPENLTEVDLVELFYKITKKINRNDELLIKEIFS